MKFVGELRMGLQVESCLCLTLSKRIPTLSTCVYTDKHRLYYSCYTIW